MFGDFFLFPTNMYVSEEEEPTKAPFYVSFLFFVVVVVAKVLVFSVAVLFYNKNL